MITLYIWHGQTNYLSIISPWYIHYHLTNIIYVLVQMFKETVGSQEAHWSNRPRSDAARAQQFLKTSLQPATNSTGRALKSGFRFWWLPITPLSGVVTQNLFSRISISGAKGWDSEFDDAQGRSEWDRVSAKGVQPGYQGYATLVHTIKQVCGDPLLVWSINPDHFKEGFQAKGAWIQ